MRKVIFAINNTINGHADHTDVIADDELHNFFAHFLNDTDVVLFGRKTYQLMQSFWPDVKDDERSTQSMIEYADKINAVKKIVFSKTLDKVDWNNCTLHRNNFIEEVKNLKRQNGKDISVGSLSLASQLINAALIDEYYFVVQPVISGKGKRLFEQYDKRTDLELVDTKFFDSGVVILHYKNKTR